MSFRSYCCFSCLFVLILLVFEANTTASTVSLLATTNQLGPTPEILAYNSGRFHPGSNTRDWWHYSGVNGARFFIPSRDFALHSYLKPSAITNQSSFLAQRAALRADPMHSPLINWQTFTNRFETESLDGIVFGYALSQVRGLNLQICAQISAGPASIPVSNTNDWSGQWKLWLHCYAQAFYLAHRFDVQRFQYFNEPNHPNAGGISPANYLHRLQLASDAFQCAVEDVNRLDHKSLKCQVLAPVSSGSPDGIYPKWGRPLVKNRHVNFLGQTDPDFSLLHKYDYHQYNSAPWQFGNSASNLTRLIAKDSSPELVLPLTLTEFNVHTAGKFLQMDETLDSPTIFPQLAAKTINLFNNSVSELYLFKLSQTDYSRGIKKNGAHYVDNTNAPYNIGTITKAGEVWRLINKGFTADRIRLELPSPSTPKHISAMACYDPASQRYYILSANCTNRTARMKINLDAWNIPSGNHVLIEEVSETCFGAVKSWEPLNSHRTVTESQPPYSVWLITVSARREFSNQIIPISDFASVRDGRYSNTAFKSGSPLRVQNNSTNSDYRSVTFLKFQLPQGPRSNIQSAFLELDAHTLDDAPLANAHIYSVDKCTFLPSVSQPATNQPVTWSQSQNLAQNVPAGLGYTNNFLCGTGETAHLVGQLVVSSKPRQKLIDITDSFRHSTNLDLTFLLVRQNGFLGDNSDAEAITISTSRKNLPRLHVVR